LHSLESPAPIPREIVPQPEYAPTPKELIREYPSINEDFSIPNDTKPIILNDDAQQEYQTMEVVEESLSLEENEKELIRKALRKHNNRRKEAANDLGISERTLYRKIKQYEL